MWGEGRRAHREDMESKTQSVKGTLKRSKCIRPVLWPAVREERCCPRTWLRAGRPGLGSPEAAKRRCLPPGQRRPGRCPTRSLCHGRPRLAGLRTRREGGQGDPVASATGFGSDCAGRSAGLSRPRPSCWKPVLRMARVQGRGNDSAPSEEEACANSPNKLSLSGPPSPLT